LVIDDVSQAGHSDGEAADLPSDLAATGRIVPLGDTAAFARETNDLLENPGSAKRLGEAGRERIATQFTVRNMIDKHVALYENASVLPAKNDKQFRS
jgi:glycosyltransferase involved in cell wall biosynthesis